MLNPRPDTSLLTLETPRLLLDRDRLARNAARMRDRCDALGVALRPHLKTAKSVDVARYAGVTNGITVSTLKEAGTFARAGYRDILYATAIVPGKFPHAARIQRESNCDLILATDSPEVVSAAAAFASANGVPLSFVIEIDCGEHRSGLPPADVAVVTLGQAIAAAPGLRLRGIMTHAGHSYGTPDHQDVRYADHLRGVTEARAGIYMFFDLAQLSRGVCTEDDIAVSVLASVIGHNHAGRALILDAGALALSKDIGANSHMPGTGYGFVCDPLTLARLGGLVVDGVHQEHGTVNVTDDGWFERLPVGSMVRILPNHACITCAGYDAYEVVSGAHLVDRWTRINGW
jgi:D-serine deaminase-like pyridoxal phosphate-dependent protein